VLGRKERGRGATRFAANPRINSPLTPKTPPPNATPAPPVRLADRGSGHPDALAVEGHVGLAVVEVVLEAAADEEAAKREVPGGSPGWVPPLQGGWGGGVGPTWR
jgi:hypothetical protein